MFIDGCGKGRDMSARNNEPTQEMISHTTGEERCPLYSKESYNPNPPSAPRSASNTRGRVAIGVPRGSILGPLERAREGTSGKEAQGRRLGV